VVAVAAASAAVAADRAAAARAEAGEMSRATTRRREIDRDRVRAAVESAEACTSAEIVVAIAPFFVGRVWRAARRAFARLGVAGTRRRTGVLVFVVPSRRQVVILPDEGACDRIDAAIWRGIAAAIAAGFGDGRGTDGLVDGVLQLGDALSVPFPRAPGDLNELPDEPRVW
jgi:uncharacterized membrane protein